MQKNETKALKIEGVFYIFLGTMQINKDISSHPLMIVRRYKISPAGRYDKVSLRHYTIMESDNRQNKLPLCRKARIHADFMISGRRLLTQVHDFKNNSA